MGREKKQIVPAWIKVPKSFVVFRKESIDLLEFDGQISIHKILRKGVRNNDLVVIEDMSSFFNPKFLKNLLLNGMVAGYDYWFVLNNGFSNNDLACMSPRWIDYRTLKNKNYIKFIND